MPRPVKDQVGNIQSFQQPAEIVTVSARILGLCGSAYHVSRARLYPDCLQRLEELLGHGDFTKGILCFRRRINPFGGFRLTIIDPAGGMVHGDYPLGKVHIFPFQGTYLAYSHSGAQGQQHTYVLRCRLFRKVAHQYPLMMQGQSWLQSVFCTGRIFDFPFSKMENPVFAPISDNRFEHRHHIPDCFSCQS